MSATSTKPAFSIVYLVRHGETSWSATGQHTSLTDLSLTERGEEEARSLGPRLGGLAAQAVFTSPLKRAMRTCALAGFGSVAKIDEDLVEWNYGEYEGRRLAEIRSVRPGWDLFRDGCPGGESPADVVRLLGSAIRLVHVKDARRRGNEWELVPLGDGDVPIRESLDALRARGYDGWLTVEWEKRWHPELAEPERALPNELQTLRALLG